MAPHLTVYSSVSRIPPAYADREIADLVAVSIAQNGRHAVTGALLYSTGQRFAQALEGDAAAVGMIMAKIRRDPRHTNILMLHDGPAPRRRFPDWSLAYNGDAPAIDVAIRAADYEAGLMTNRALEDLLVLMERLAA
jgi:hypothetical protein